MEMQRQGRLLHNVRGRKRPGELEWKEREERVTDEEKTEMESKLEEKKWVKERKRKDRALQLSSEGSHSLLIERSAAMEQDNQSACLASVLC